MIDYLMKLNLMLYKKSCDYWINALYILHTIFGILFLCWCWFLLDHSFTYNICYILVLVNVFVVFRSIFVYYLKTKQELKMFVKVKEFY